MRTKNVCVCRLVGNNFGWQKLYITFRDESTRVLILEQGCEVNTENVIIISNTLLIIFFLCVHTT